MNPFDYIEHVFTKNPPLGAMDKPDVRDYSPVRLFGSAIPIDQFEGDVNLRNNYAHKQDGQKCTSFSLSGIIEIMIKIHSYKDKSDNIVDIVNAKPNTLWERQKIKHYDDKGKRVTDGTADDSYGDYLQNALKTAKHIGVDVIIGKKIVTVKLKGYAKILDSEMNIWIRKGYPTFTGSEWIVARDNQGKLTSTDDLGYLWTKGIKSGGHCYNVPEIRLGVNVMQNSHGEKWGRDKNGTALMSKEKVASCFSKYIVEIDWEDLYRQLNS